MARDDIADFGTYLAEERHASQNTICSYLRDVTQFSAYLREHQSCTLRQAGGEMIQDYMSWMRGRGKSAASVTRFLASVKSFYNFLLSAGAVKANPAKSISADRAERKYPEILTSKEVELFLEQPRCVDAKGYRDHAMLELLYATGIRVSELISLDLKDLNLSAGFIRCASRGKERIIPLYHTAVKALQDYVRDIRPQLIADGGEQALFVNMNGERMSRQGFWKIIKYYQEKAGIEKDITPTPCATPLPSTCWKTARTCGPSRRCWVTRTFPPPRSTPMWSSASSKTSIKRLIPEHEENSTASAVLFSSAMPSCGRSACCCRWGRPGRGKKFSAARIKLPRRGSNP